MKRDNIKSRKDTSHEDYLASRVMAVFAAVMVILAGLTYLWNAYDVGTTFFAAMRVNNILIWVSAAGVMGSLAWLVSDIKKDRLKRSPVLNGAMATVFFLALLGSLLLIKYNYVVSKRVLYIALPVAAILHLIYCSYQREFFSLCVTHFSVILAVWMAARQAGRTAAVASVIAIVICGAAVLIFLSARKKGGYISVGKLKIKVYDNKNITSQTVFAVYGVTALMVAAALFLAAPYAYYILYALAAFLVIEAVYFTVRLI